MGQTESALPRCSSIWYCCLLQPPSSVSRSHQLFRMLHQKLMQIPGTTMVDTHMPIMDIMAILMPITGQEGREDPLNQSQLPMLTLRLTLTTTIEDIMDILMAMAFMDMEDTFGEGRGDQQSLTPSLQLMPRLTHGIFMEDTMDMDMDQDTLTTDTLMDTIWDKDHQNKT